MGALTFFYDRSQNRVLYKLKSHSHFVKIDLQKLCNKKKYINIFWEYNITK